jgi:hypothetical protein
MSGKETIDNPERKPFDAWLKSLIQQAFGFPKDQPPRRIEEDGMIIEGPES